MFKCLCFPTPQKSRYAFHVNQFAEVFVGTAYANEHVLVIQYRRRFAVNLATKSKDGRVKMIDVARPELRH